jgi:hypothetical protein
VQYVEITHYEPPQRQISKLRVLVADDVAALMAKLAERGLRLESEHLRMVGDLSLTITHEDGDVAFEFVHGYSIGGVVVDGWDEKRAIAVEKLVRKYAAKIGVTL